MNMEYLVKAQNKMPNTPLLINVISRRVKQLNFGERPLVKPDFPAQDAMDVALKEVAEGKLTAEMQFVEEPETEADDLFSMDSGVISL